MAGATLDLKGCAGGRCRCLRKNDPQQSDQDNRTDLEFVPFPSIKATALSRPPLPSTQRRGQRRATISGLQRRTETASSSLHRALIAFTTSYTLLISSLSPPISSGTLSTLSVPSHTSCSSPTAPSSPNEPHTSLPQSSRHVCLFRPSRLAPVPWRHVSSSHKQEHQPLQCDCPF